MQNTVFTYTFLVFVAGASCKLETEAVELASAASAATPPPPPLLVSLLAPIAEVANDLKGVPVLNFLKNPARCLLVDSCVVVLINVKKLANYRYDIKLIMRLF